VAQATLQGVEGTVSSLGQLTQLSTELTQSMARFKRRPEADETLQ
jgi:hypothetical protein